MFHSEFQRLSGRKALCQFHSGARRIGGEKSRETFFEVSAAAEKPLSRGRKAKPRTAC